MNIEPKILNPICIRLDKKSSALMTDEKNYELGTGVMFSNEHYGLNLIINHNGIQREIVYPTQNKIAAVGVENNVLRIFEYGKKFPWCFDKAGKLKKSTFNEFTDKFIDEFNSEVYIVDANPNMFIGEGTLVNPIRIKISRNPKESTILKDGNIKENYPLYPGVILGTIHYGFILIIDTEKGQKEVVYPTQNRIDAVGIEGDVLGDLKIFENGKYYPWLFSYDGKLKKDSSYNPYSRRDVAFIEDCYGLNDYNSEYCFTLQKKK